MIYCRAWYKRKISIAQFQSAFKETLVGRGLSKSAKRKERTSEKIEIKACKKSKLAEGTPEKQDKMDSELKKILQEIRSGTKKTREQMLQMQKESESTIGTRDEETTGEEV